MQITKYGHSCLLVEEQAVRILIDPGSYSAGFSSLTNLNALFISHAHQDHFDLPTVRQLHEKNPGIKIYVNKQIGLQLEQEDVHYEVFEYGMKENVNGLTIEGFGRDHAPLYSTLPAIQNTAYLVNGRFYYPGDSFYAPERSVEILALPVAGPWLKISEAIDFAILLSPKQCFPVHDGILKNPGLAHRLPEQILTAEGISFEVLKDNEPKQY